MKTLYDLLGALPTDDAEDLRTAFRKAVKGAHPDIRPDDPDAALKFRQIIRANDILRDAEQREAYDHLLELAEQERELAARNVLATKIYKLGLGVVALAGISVTSIASYVLLAQVSTASLPSVQVEQLDALARGSAEIAAITQAGPWDLAGPWELNDRAAIPPKEENATVGLAATVPAVGQQQADADGTATSAVPAPSETAPSEASRARGIAAYRNGDIVFYRMRKLDRAFSDIEKAKRIDRAGHNRSESDPLRKPRSPQAGTESGLAQVFQQRTPGRQAPRAAGLAFARMP
jgi:curved DNA-binding protein CbpA